LGPSKPCVEGIVLVSASLIRGDEPQAYELIDGDASARLILVCDHASNRLPAALGRLGIPEARLEQHIAWDIGAAGVTRRLQRRFGASAILASYSRLVIDLNRGLGDSSAIPSISDGILLPGNLGLDAEARTARIRDFHEPYHAAIEQLIARLSDGEQVPVFIGIHSFTPRFHGADRPWHAGVLWDRDPRLAVPLLARLRAEPGLVIGDNEPYSGRHPADYSIDRHAETRGMAHAGIELRQDLVGDAAGQDRWAGLLGDALEAILADQSLFRPLSPVNPL
jgi:predicted N-formylglutamate amidohydrolase